MPTTRPLGTQLDVRDERWILTREQRFDTCRLLTLGGADPSNTTKTLRVIEPFDRPRPIARQKLRRRPRRAVLRAAISAIASARTSSGLWSAAAADIDILPYQLEPALAVVGGATRLLLADAVGLGKTIQAGLILAELRARGWIERALIVCPCGLRDTWARELRARFGLAAATVDQAALAARVASLPPGVNPWGTDAIVIVSIDLLKRQEVLDAVDRVPIDLLIADEAHHLTPGTDRGAAVAQLARRCPWVALLSATPHSGDAAAFSYLTSIGEQRDSLTVFRRTRRDAGTTRRRRTHVLAVYPTDQEQTLLAGVDRYVRDIWRARGATDPAARLVAITIARRAASSIEALSRTLTRRLALMNGDAIKEPEQGLLPWDETDLADEAAADTVLAARGLDDPAAERRSLRHLLDLARVSGDGSKIGRLLRLLRVIREPALVFTEFRDTLLAISGRLSGVSHGVMHGGMPADARHDAAARFTDGRTSILLATDAAGEGLNLHHRCRLVIDMELPWNPLRLEQRVGRVDRIGQRRTVHAIRLFHPGTIESRVLDHLHVRLERAGDAMARCASEREVATAIFDGGALPPDPLVPESLVVSSAVSEASRLSWQRSIRSHHRSSSTRCWTSSRTGRLTILFRTTLMNVAGWAVSDRMDALAIVLARAPANRLEWRRLVESLEQQWRIAAGIDAEPSLRIGLADRIAAIRAMLAHRARVEYQRSLFDGRADAEADSRDKIAAQLDAALERVHDAATSPPVRGHRELIAAWGERRR